MAHSKIQQDRRASDVRETQPPPAGAEAEMLAKIAQFGRLSPLAAISLATKGEP
jgi:hypothetical protein